MNHEQLRQYLNRIDLPELIAKLPASREESTSFTLADLNAIIEGHATSIPFESISPFIGRGVTPDIDAIFDKVVTNSRGGYCHEHSPLIRSVLESFNVPCRHVMARVYPGDPNATLRTHLTLIASIDGKEYLVDPGFGGNTPTLAIPDDNNGTIVDTKFGQFRITNANEGLAPELVLESERVLEYKSNNSDSFRVLYGFNYNPVTSTDIQVANWFTGSFPGGLFTGNLIACAYSDSGEKFTLTNRKFRAVSTQESTDSTRQITEDAEYFRILEEKFGIALDPEGRRAVINGLSEVPSSDIDF